MLLDSDFEFRLARIWNAEIISEVVLLVNHEKLFAINLLDILMDR
jgi:hypothetical protein